MWILEKSQDSFLENNQKFGLRNVAWKKILCMCVLASILSHNFVLVNLTEKNPNMCRCTAATITANILFTGCSSF